MMLWIMRTQPFKDGNKRVATLAANKVLLIPSITESAGRLISLASSASPLAAGYSDAD